MSLIITDICLDDAFAGSIVKGKDGKDYICLSNLVAAPFNKDKNGRTYLKVCVASRREPDKNGNQYTVYLNQTKEQREGKAEKKYVGSGKEITAGSGNTKSPAPASDNYVHSGDLPF